MYKIGQWGGFLSGVLRPFLKTSLPLMKNFLKSIGKNVWTPLGLTASALGIDAAILKKMLGSGTTPLIILNEELNDIIRIVKSLEESGLLIKGVSETIKNEAKIQQGGFLRMLLGTLSASLLRNLLIGKGTIRAGEAKIRAGQDF